MIMENRELLTVEAISRIGLMFLNGDDLENVLLDQIGHTDYDFDKFNRLKKVLLKIEKISTVLDISAILWQAYPTNSLVGAPLVCGSSLPCEGCKRRYLNPFILKTINEDSQNIKQRPNGAYSHYQAVKNSDDEIVGVLELLVGRGEKIDVSCKDMFVCREEEEAE